MMLQPTHQPNEATPSDMKKGAPTATSPGFDTPSARDERLGFVCDYEDPHAQLTREFILLYYPMDHSVEMVPLAWYLRSGGPSLTPLFAGAV
jgi:hypothetical protein